VGNSVRCSTGMTETGLLTGWGTAGPLGTRLEDWGHRAEALQILAEGGQVLEPHARSPHQISRLAERPAAGQVAFSQDAS
jgi:hypothetical protein